MLHGGPAVADQQGILEGFLKLNEQELEEGPNESIGSVWVNDDRTGISSRLRPISTKNLFITN